MHDFRKEIKAERIRKRLASGKMPAEERFIRTGEMVPGFSVVRTMEHIKRFLSFNWRMLETKALNEGIRKLPVNIMMSINCRRLTQKERMYGKLPDSTLFEIRSNYLPVVTVLLGPERADYLANRMLQCTFSMSIANIIYTQHIAGALDNAMEFYGYIRADPLRRYIITYDTGEPVAFVNPIFAGDIRTPSYIAVKLLGMMKAINECGLLASMVESHRLFRLSRRNRNVKRITNLVPDPQVHEMIDVRERVSGSEAKAQRLGWMIGKTLYEYENALEDPKAGETLVRMVGQGHDLLPSEVKLTKSIESENQAWWVGKLDRRYHRFVKNRLRAAPVVNDGFIDTLDVSWFTMPWAQQRDSETE